MINQTNLEIIVTKGNPSHTFAKSTYVRAERDIESFKTKIFVKDGFASLAQNLSGNTKAVLESTYNTKEEQEEDHKSLLFQLSSNDCIKAKEIDSKDEKTDKIIYEDLTEEGKKVWKQLKDLGLDIEYNKTERQHYLYTDSIDEGLDFNFDMDLALRKKINPDFIDFDKVNVRIIEGEEDLDNLFKEGKLDLQILKPYKDKNERYCYSFIDVPMSVVLDFVLENKKKQ